MLSKEWLNEIETPCIVADMSKVRRNIANMQAVAAKNGCALRPHIKTHKNVEIAKMQIDAGACGISCAKISEAEVMADGGIEDIFVAYPLIGQNRIQRAIRLAKRVKRLILAVDSIEGASALSEAAAAENIILEIRLEVDTGLKRTGTIRENVVAVAKAAAAMPCLRLTGIYTFKSLVYENKPTTDASAAGKEEGAMMAEIAKELTDLGINITDISAGSTPTGTAVAETGLVTEIRPGTYVFYDYMTFKEGACSYDDIAARIYATVVSTPAPDYAIIDGGTKTFPTDPRLNVAPYFYPGYAVIEDNENLILSKLNEEHGIIRPNGQTGVTGLRTGQILRLVPVHVCTAVNLQNNIYLLDNDALRQVKVDARGMLV